MTFLKKTSAWLPIAMSSVALLLVVGYVLFNGVQQPKGDEGAVARMFQILLAGQLPIIGYFAIRWFPKHQKEVVQIIAIQVLAALVPFFTIIFLEM